jgi:hypothetical protein
MIEWPGKRKIFKYYISKAEEVPQVPHMSKALGPFPSPIKIKKKKNHCREHKASLNTLQSLPAF